MKKSLHLFALSVLSLITGTCFSQRYLSEVFPSVSINPNIIYANNLQVLTGTPTAVDLHMDVYTPAGAPDPLTDRPVIVYLHTGSFLPPYINQTPTGSRNDSASAEMCRRFARRGYVVANIDYRLGWNPAATGAAGQDIRTGTLLQAVYRAIQDVRSCVRFLKASVATGNPYGIDSNKVILCGQGSGGYVALASATLNNPVQIGLPKFVSTTTNATYGFVAGQPYVNQTLMGDFDGFGGIPQLNNPNNTPGHTSNVQFVCNMGGAMGDSSWLAAGNAPMVCFHVVGDPFAPYNDGIVVVPTTGDFVVDVTGSYGVIQRADAYGNNNCFINAGFTDVFTTKANQYNNGLDGLYPFNTNPAPQAGPWEWFDSSATVATAQLYGLTAAQGTQIYMGALLTNPNVSKAKGMAYIDTVQGYLNPRIVYCLGLSTGLNEQQNTSQTITVYPNPASEKITVTSNDATHALTKIEMYDMQGRKVKVYDNLKLKSFTIYRGKIKSGVYLLHVFTGQKEFTQRITFE